MGTYMKYKPRGGVYIRLSDRFVYRVLVVRANLPRALRFTVGSYKTGHSLHVGFVLSWGRACRFHTFECTVSFLKRLLS